MPAQVTARVDRLLARLRALRGNVALFTHGHIGAAIGAALDRACRWSRPGTS